VLIINTNSDLNLYKEMSLNEDADKAPSKSSCCSTATTESKGTKGLSDVDFNHWTGELRHNPT
jgi:hypothetical protein